MSTHSFISRKQWGLSRFAFSVLGGLLIALLLVVSLFSTALASSHGSVDQPPNVARADVSVLRLLVSYADSKGSTIAQCTGLGVLVNSWTTQSPDDQNNWVLTDGSLVNTGSEVACAPGNLPGTLSSIQTMSSSAYNPQPVLVLPETKITSETVHCQMKPCGGGIVLFSFHTDAKSTQPFVDLATTVSAQGVGIGLTGSTGTPSPSNTDQQQIGPSGPYAQQMAQFRTPSQVQINNDSNQGEIGMPIVNNAGELTGMRLSGAKPQTVDMIGTFLTSVLSTQSVPSNRPNALHDHWNTGVTDYYQKKDFQGAQSAFQAASAVNPQFQPTSSFSQLGTTANENGNSHTGKGKDVPPPDGITLFGSFIPYVWLILLGVVVLIVLILLVALAFLRRRRVLGEYAEAERTAALNAQQIAATEAVQQQQPPRDWSQQPTLIQNSPVLQPVAGTGHLPSCPRCGTPVPMGSIACPNCRLQLAESGPYASVTPPPSAPVASARSLDEQPTLDMGSRLAKNGHVDLDKTVPYAMQHLKNNHLGLVVGTRSDPGIKRKYKPNEDSLFAAQGARNGQSSPQQFGLFVIADGMGGHANGQDASRLAIQTIIDYVLPKLLTYDEAQGNAFAQLLVEGVQSANRAVHQHNMDRHGDMGTTVTAALVVETTAYVANVGDSRTYLYREAQGLSKVTQDHSVVASLVEAGIIKPDDIYTHPKRNQIYRSLGEKPAVDVDAFTVPLRVGDKLLLCSDGLWDMVRDPKIEDVVKSAVPDPEMTGEALIKAALDGGGEDNVSVIVVQVTQTAKSTGKIGVNLLSKPDSVQMPPLPPL